MMREAKIVGASNEIHAGMKCMNIGNRGARGNPYENLVTTTTINSAGFRSPANIVPALAASRTPTRFAFISRAFSSMYYDIPLPDFPSRLEQERFGQNCGFRVHRLSVAFIHLHIMEFRVHFAEAPEDLRSPVNGVLPALLRTQTKEVHDYLSPL
jgi:hypothetical protein